MTEPPGSDPPRPTAGEGRHRRAETAGRAPSRRRIGVVAAVVVGVLVVATAATLVLRNTGDDDGSAGGSVASSTAGDGPTGGGASSGGASSGDAGSASTSSSAAGCPSDGTLSIAAAPDIAPVVADVVQGLENLPCPVDVEAAQPADVAAAVTAGGLEVEAWIADSSAWVARTDLAAVTLGASPSIASSPVVLAVAAGAVPAETDLGAVLGSRRSASPIRVGLGDPERTAPALAAVLAMQNTVSGTADARAALTWGLRSSPTDLPTAPADLLRRAATDPGVAVPATEQAVVAHNARSGAAELTALPLGAQALALDYPFVLADAAANEAAAPVLEALLGATGRAALDAAGFRDATGALGPELATAAGQAASVTGAAPLPDVAALDAAVQAVQTSNEPTRLLAALDVSGSMQAEVPGADGATRIDLAKAAAARGLGLYPTSSEIGLWEFATNLTANTDHRELVPITPLGPGPDGLPGAQRLTSALDGVAAIPDGGTGLYDTVLAGVRAVRADWDPDRVNVLLILSDGMNDEDNGIALADLLTTLAAELDPARPVPVVSIAFGPDSDVGAMTVIGRVTGGATYVAQDPLEVSEIFLDAVGQRLCRPTC